MLSAAVLALGTASSYASCQVSHGKWMLDQESTATIQLAAGASCSYRVSPGSSTDVKSVAITQKPQHGSASASGSLVDILIRYQANPGYKGSDEFVYSISGATSRSVAGLRSPEGVAKIRVSVDVQ
jgi:hypothetical protein